MRILLNASNIHVGGGTQVALSFIHLLTNFEDCEFVIFASTKVYDQIDQDLLPKGAKVYCINYGIKDLLSGKSRFMHKLEKQINPDAVFTVFGPSYWTPKSKHLMGFALPWLINPETKAFGELPLKMWFKKKAQNTIKAFFTRRNAQYFVVETEDVKQRLKQFFNIPLDNTWVVDNTYNQYFKDVKILPTRSDEWFKFITITANYPHKNIKILKKVIPILKNRGLKVCFTLTIPHFDFENIFGNENEYIKNVGPISSKKCPEYYNQSDALFLPTLLECFTASYPEAMIMQRPILTSDLPFAKQICGEDNALFFDPLNPESIADSIEQIVNDDKLYNQLVSSGLSRVKEFQSSKERADSYVKILEDIVNRN